MRVVLREIEKDSSRSEESRIGWWDEKCEKTKKKVRGELKR